jgi:hypothetical protein
MSEGSARPSLSPRAGHLSAGSLPGTIPLGRQGSRWRRRPPRPCAPGRRAVPGDQAPLLQPAHPLVNRRDRQPHRRAISSGTAPAR